MYFSLKIWFRIFTAILFLVTYQDMESMGVIPVMNYQRNAYSFGPQNWDITQDEMGKIYVANYNGMLSFDGQRWRQYYLPNYSTVRCVLYDKESDRIYVGGSEEFGYFSPTPNTGVLTYTSLSSPLPDHNKTFSEVWNIVNMAGNIIFRCDDCLLELKGSSIEKLNIPGRIASCSQVGRKIFLGMEDGRVLSIKDGNFGTLTEEFKLDDLKIVSVLPFDDNSLLICTPIEGIFSYKEGKISPYVSIFSNFLKEHQIFCATCENGIYVFGTVTGGALILNSNNGEINVINKETGMKNNTVLNIGFNRDGNLWLCLDNGIAYAALDSPCKRLIGESDFIGAGYTSARLTDKILLGTNQGLYTQKLGTTEFINHPTSKPDIPGQIWNITPAGSDLFISTDRGLYVYDGSNFSHLESLPGVFKTLLLPDSETMAIASTYDSFYLLKKEGNSWINKGKISGGNNLKGDFLIDDENRIWVAHWQKGIYLLPFNDKDAKFTSCRIFNKESGLPADDSNTFALFEGEPISSTYTGFFTLNPKNINAREFTELTSLIKEGRKGHIKEMSDGSLVLIDEDGLTIIKRKSNGTYESKEISGPGLYHEIIPGFTDIRKFSADELLVSSQSGFTLVDIKAKPSIHSVLPMISAVYANRDSLLYQSPLTPDNSGGLKVPHNLNSVRFEFAYPECTFGEATEFSSYLENYEKDWSPFSPEASREYTKLSEGNYVLHFKAKDIYTGEILESSFGFTVTPPWFRSTWAKGIYSVLSFLVLFLMFISVRKKLIQIRYKIEKRKEKEMAELRKESERETIRKDKEIAELKNERLEKEIKHKSDELSSTTMSLISKNEILREIGDQISKIQKMSTEVPISVVQKNLSKLQSSIEENISRDQDWNTFNKNFELVYGDYMKRLLRIHPSLSQSEKRLCCYIRMGLSSKEIAPLINISFRSVEMARYRLRKKMRLTQDAVLSDYLSEI